MTTRPTAGVAAILYVFVSVPELLAECSTPDRLLADTGCWISRTRYAVNAPTSVQVLEGLEPCPSTNIAAEIRIIQQEPEVRYLMRVTGVGSMSYTLEAPASTGKCYICDLSASVSSVLTPLTASDTDGPVCWEPPCPDTNMNGICDSQESTGPDPNQDSCPGGAPCTSPLVINLQPGPYELSNAGDPVQFDIDADGLPNRITWTARNSEMAFLAMDRNQNGRIDDGSELFGNWSILGSGSRAANGFEALKEFDANRDGIVSGLDPQWSALLLWVDVDHDGFSEPGELQRIDATSVRAVATTYHWTGRRDAGGNFFGYEGLVYFAHGRRPLYDVYFRTVP